MNDTLKYHLIGIAGAGMSAIARLLKHRGAEVKGSDMHGGETSRKLVEQGIDVCIGHDSCNVGDADVVVYSAAISQDNAELSEARDRGLQVLERSEMLGLLMKQYPIRIAVAGTHGKTSTTAMIDRILHRAGLNPTSLIGSDVDELEGNTRCGGDEIFLTEACEAFGSFLHLDPTIAVITNIEADHLDYYGDLEHVEEAFHSFAERVDPEGVIFACSDNPRVVGVLSGSGRKLFTYGVQKTPHYLANFVSTDSERPSYSLVRAGLDVGVVRLSVPGEHNVLNSLAAAAVASYLGVDITNIQSALADFTGAQRRFQVLYDKNDMMVIDDYAHHPAEITASLTGARQGYGKRILAIFQPHLYSRTKLLLGDFVEALKLADEVIVIPAYPAREVPADGVDGDSIVEAMNQTDAGKAVFVDDKNDVVQAVQSRLVPGTMALFMGAGDIGLLSRELAERL